MNAFWSFLQERGADITVALRDHLTISAAAVLFGCLVAIPLGIALVYNRFNWLNSIVFFLANLLQTVPSLALLAILIPLMGIGMKPAIIALFLYSIMPILRNTYDGFESVDRGVLESARGMGYGTLQRIIQIQLPLALPYIMSGIRVTTVYIISWATLAALIGAGGLGQLIVSGLGVNKPELIVTGALGAIVLAFLIDGLLGWLERVLTRRFGRTSSIAA
ncbi:ABC transporter permease [Paenibacillus apiarius]|uniref:ABC transporter permease n=1 Tax=Paenibacillus apiarius TaxID=46240 RepID=A0ABT4DUP4_9BACL|nr:ABC transporter permease [Paenibacillus apiarius]MCY9514492.1 ABC transporter permease [Paenibacillus apiarius]MCY9520970.1 ABC transporter permease [Paenibacillus apiarius]MCY9551817.1 ABC transporter permease [Paenibacillus apiarius]MCY9557704.1 ABC transporter permease [Paenibacillus apiarius]MCY9684391.1 ABC transporter permease [Paenibacillus apiarius]